MFKKRKLEKCLVCKNKSLQKSFEYSFPPEGETKFSGFSGEVYSRYYLECKICGHFSSSVTLDDKKLYSGSYVESTYNSIDKINKTFKKIISLPSDYSDNYGRVNFLENFIECRKESIYRILDVGSGLGVFPFAIREKGFDCEALDPDNTAVSHMKEYLNIPCHHADFLAANLTKKYDMITFNKVLEHIESPFNFIKKAKTLLEDGGLLYIELPDGEMASNKGASREEFFLEHIHVFSFKSLLTLGQSCGLVPLHISRLQEASTKFTLRSIWKVK